MYFLTNRRLNEGNNPDLIFPRTITFATGDNDPMQNIFFCHTDNGVHTEVGSDAFFSALKQHGSKHLVFLFHGFNVPPNNAIDLAERVQTGLGDAYHVCLCMWACEDSEVNIAERYITDRAKAKGSGLAFARAIALWSDWANQQTEPCFKKMSLIAHSMGNRVMCYMFQELVGLNRAGLIPGMFKHIFSFAGDIPNHAFEKGNNEIGELVPLACKYLTTFYADDDNALRASKGVNYGDLDNEPGRRLGHTGYESWTRLKEQHPSTLCTDWSCDDFNDRHDSMGHNYIIGKNGEITPAFQKMKDCLDSGIVSLPDNSILGGMVLK